jgi:hypothetical protein
MSNCKNEARTKKKTSKVRGVESENSNKSEKKDFKSSRGGK